MKETGLLMTPENYGKTERGDKTHTRRIVQWSTWITEDDKLKLSLQRPVTGLAWYEVGQPIKCFCCPFGMIGDRVYVKEGLEKTSTGDLIQYRRDKVHLQPPVMGGAYGWRWRRDTLSPLHMPKWAARLWLEITEVRVERLQEISEWDACAEGCGDYSITPTAANRRFRELWESIHGPGSWVLNPWVWVIGFRKLRS